MVRYLGPGYGEFRVDYEPILARIAGSKSHSHSGGGARTAIVDHGNPDAWRGTSASAPATTVACTSDAEVLKGVLDSLDSHESVFVRLMALADALGCMWRFSLFFSLFPLPMSLLDPYPSQVTPRVGIEGVDSESPESSRNNVVPSEK